LLSKAYARRKGTRKKCKRFLPFPAPGRGSRKTQYVKRDSQRPYNGRFANRRSARGSVAVSHKGQADNNRGPNTAPLAPPAAGRRPHPRAGRSVLAVVRFGFGAPLLPRGKRPARDSPWVKCTPICRGARPRDAAEGVAGRALLSVSWGGLVGELIRPGGPGMEVWEFAARDVCLKLLGLGRVGTPVVLRSRAPRPPTRVRPAGHAVHLTRTDP
jgi:hypothetical protein